MWEQYLPTTSTDIVLVVVLVLSAVFALFRGFVRELLAICAWVGAFFVTIYCFSVTNRFFHSFIENEMISHGLAAALLFLLSLILFSLLAHMVASWVRQTPLSSLDRILGFVFGLVRGAFVICLAYISLVWFYKDKELPDWATKAHTLPLIQKGANYLMDLVPEEQRIKIVKLFQDFLSDKNDQQEESFMNQKNNDSMISKGAIIKPRSEQNPKENVVLHPYTKQESVTNAPVNATTNSGANSPNEPKKPSHSLDDPIHSGKKALEPSQTGYDEESREQLDRLVGKTQ